MTTNSQKNPMPKWKKWLLGLGIPSGIIVIALAISPFWADYEKPILRNQLPEPAQVFLQTHYGNSKTALARKDVEWLEKEYEVILTDGIQITFDRHGEWKEIKHKAGCVPMDIVPAPIQEYINENHPGLCVREISQDRREIEVELTNRLELTFSKKNFLLIDWDD